MGIGEEGMGREAGIVHDHSQCCTSKVLNRFILFKMYRSWFSARYEDTFEQEKIYEKKTCGKLK